MKQKSASQNFMRSVAVVVVLTLAVVEIAWTSFEFLTVNEGLQYFGSQPRRLAYVLAIALMGGGLTLVFSRLPSRMRRGFGLLLLGSAAVGTTLFLGVVVHDLIALPGPMRESGIREGMVVVLIAFLLGALLFWFEFVKLWRRPTIEQSV